MQKIYSSEFDYLIFSEDVIPSKKSRHKRKRIIPFLKWPTYLAPVKDSPAVRAFEEKMRSKTIPEFGDKFEYYGKNWPIGKEHFLYVYIEAGFTAKDFKEKDTDNLPKVVLDSMKGTIFEDDNQVTSLLVQKCISENPYFVVAIKKRSHKEIVNNPFPKKLFTLRR